MIPHSKPSITDDDAERVARVVRSGQLAQGPEVAALERELAARLGVQDAAAVASGSAALELALGALAVGAGDEVLIASYVCDALYHAVRRVGATPVRGDAAAAARRVHRAPPRAGRTIPHGTLKRAGAPADRRGAPARLSPLRARPGLRPGRRHRGARHAWCRRAPSGLPPGPPRPRSRRLSRSRPAVGGVLVDPVLSGVDRRRRRARAARGCGGPRERRRGKSVPMRQWVPIPRRATAVPGRVRAWGGVGGHVGAPHLVIAATLARVAFVVALTLPPVRRAFSASGLGWVYLVVLAFPLALVGVPLVRALAHWWGVLDRPAARKVHMTATPLLGGAAVYGAFAATVLFNFTFSLQLKGVAVGATIVVAVGLLDDVFDVPARWKLAGQAVAVAVAMAYGVVLDTVPTAWPGSGVINVALTLVW